MDMKLLRNHSRWLARIRWALALSLFFWTIPLFLSPVAAADTHEALFVPWSGYWWPTMKGGLGTGLDYRGNPAPLEKYHLLTSGVTTGTALQAYLGALYDPNAPAWYGLCADWARAASWENVNVLPSSEDNLIFRVGDKKGLLTLAHVNDIVRMGQGADPATFHFWLLYYIKDQKRAFAADLDPGEQVWTYPIYKYDMQTSRSAGKESVRVRVYYADDSVPPDYRGTLVRTADYTYDLTLDAVGAVTGGQWTGVSVTDHPEFMHIPLSVGTGFPGLDYAEVKRLARSKDDWLEHGDYPVEIGPGTYNLILLDKDVYRIPARPGDGLVLRIEKQPGSLRNMDAVILSGGGQEVRRQVITEGTPLEVLLEAASPPYTVTLTQDDYEDPNIYQLKLDMRKPFSQWVPYLPRTAEWSGFALTNPGNERVDGIALTTREADGTPIQTLLGPLSLEPGQRRVFFLSDLPRRLTEYLKTNGITLAADAPVDLLNLIGSGNRYLSAFVQGDMRGNRLVIPDTAAAMTPGTTMFGGVRNESFEQEATITARVYAADGRLLQQIVRTLAAGAVLPVRPGEDPFYSLPRSGWIEVAAAGDQPLSGFQYISDASGAESLFALPVGGVRKIVPHITEGGFWKTSVTLINPNDAENRIRLHALRDGADTSRDVQVTLAPREKRVVELQDLFGRPVGDPRQSVVEITGDLPLVGYYRYGTLAGKDYAVYALLEERDFRDRLSLPHYAGNDGYWWTGVAICNASSAGSAVTVRMEPYDRSGNLMVGGVLTVPIDAGAYEVFDVASRFGAAAPDIGSIRFRVQDGAGVIGGFYLYGNAGHNVLSGANMR
jgi:hypothetical protein